MIFIEFLYIVNIIFICNGILTLKNVLAIVSGEIWIGIGIWAIRVVLSEIYVIKGVMSGIYAIKDVLNVTYTTKVVLSVIKGVLNASFSPAISIFIYPSTSLYLFHVHVLYAFSLSYLFSPFSIFSPSLSLVSQFPNT